MRSLSGVRIVLAAIVVCAVLGLSLAVHHGANGAVTTPEPTISTRPSAAPVIRAQPGAGPDQLTLPPPGFTNFQMLNPDEVRESAPAYATEAQIETAHNVNTKINEQIVWRETRLWSVEL